VCWALAPNRLGCRNLPTPASGRAAFRTAIVIGTYAAASSAGGSAGPACELGVRRCRGRSRADPAQTEGRSSWRVGAGACRRSAAEPKGLRGDRRRFKGRFRPVAMRIKTSTLLLQILAPDSCSRFLLRVLASRSCFTFLPRAVTRSPVRRSADDRSGRILDPPPSSTSSALVLPHVLPPRPRPTSSATSSVNACALAC